MSTAIEKSPAAPRAGAKKTSAVPLLVVQSKAFVHTAQVLICVAFLALWETASRQGWVDQNLFGQPSGIWTAIVDYLPSEKGLDSLQATGAAVGVSFVIGSATGTVAGLVLGLSPTLNAIFGPFLAPINSVPRIALAPLFIAWFGLTMTAKVVLAVSIVFFILAENARSTVRSVDSDLMMMARVVGLKRVSLLLKVVLPSAVPTLFAGLRLTFTYALLGVVASEMVAATGGVGQEIVLYSSSYQINTVFAILVELMVVAVVMNWLFTAVERRLLVWQETS
jgi:NitT/TauT family transport system permease protein